MGAALEKTKDTVLRREWEQDCSELYERTREARGLVKKRAKIEDKELKDVLPLHPYAALLLKHMASYYAGDVRSMFDFLKNDTGDEIKGFKWFIDHYGPMHENPLLTVDMLWDFFYEKGKELLDRDVRKILDCFDRARNMIADEPRVLKAILLMQAIYEKTGSQVDVLAPSEKNVEYTFMGSDLDDGVPTKIAESLVRKKILYKTPGANLYNALLNAEEEIPAVEVKFGSLIDEGELQSVISPRGALRLRYDFTVVTSANFQAKLNLLRNQNADNKIHAVIGFAQNGNDAYDLGKKISEAAQNPSYPFVFIDATLTPLGDDRFEQISDSKSKYEYWLKKDKNMAGQYSKNATEVLKDWKSSVSKGEFLIYHDGAVSGKRLPMLDALYTELNIINRSQYPLSLESFALNATDTMWQANQLKNGVGLGAGSGKNLSQFSCVPKDLGEAWTTEKYWEKLPHLTISKIKLFVDGVIAKAFETGDRISIRDIYEALYQRPYGIMACNQTAFVLGFVLKEYADGSYSSSDGIKSDKLDIEKLQNIVSEYIAEKMTPSLRYKDKYIVKMTAEMKAFVAASAEVFNRPVTVSRMEDIRDTLIRPAMCHLPFPMWCLKYALNDMPFQNQKEDVKALIDLFCAFANSGSTGGRTDQDIAGEIGRLCMTRPNLAQDLKQLVNEQKIKEGMKRYLAVFEDGVLPELGDEIGDNGQYLNRLQNRFRSNSGAAFNWVWYKETADQEICRLILEYKIIAASNRVIQRASSFTGCLEEWCSICKNIRISYLYAKNYWDDLEPFMEVLFGIKKTGQLQETQRETFLRLLEEKGEAFKDFYNRQESVFARACSYVLQGMDEGSVSELYKQLPGSDLFTMEKSSYQQRVADAVKAWNENQAGAALRKQWADATKTESPRAWSKKYLMPILCMVNPSEEELAAKQAFDTLNAVAKKKMDQHAIDVAAQFLNQHPQLLEDLEDAGKRDDMFRKKIIGHYDVLLPDIDEVKHELEEKLLEEPYDWFYSGKLKEVLKKKAEYIYNGTGYEMAMQKIDEMEEADVKRYLKALIEKNMTVGIEIIRER